MLHVTKNSQRKSNFKCFTKNMVIIKVKKVLNYVLSDILIDLIDIL